MNGEAALIMLNFVCIMTLYGAMIYLIGEQTKLRDQMANVREYQATNERQLNNLINDINTNDKLLQERITNLHQ